MIGTAKCTVTLGRIDVTITMSTLSTYRVDLKRDILNV